MNLLIIVCFIIFSAVVAVITGVGEATRLREPITYSRLWHNCKFASWVGLLILGFSLGMWATFLSLGMTSIVWSNILWFALAGLIFFIIHDGLINVITYNRNFFYVSKTTTAFTEPFAHWWIKIPVLLIVLFLNIFLRKKIGKD